MDNNQTPAADTLTHFGIPLSGGEVTINPGTMYGTLSKMEKDGLITFLREEDKRKLYQISSLWREILDIEIRWIERLYKNSTFFLFSNLYSNYQAKKISTNNIVFFQKIRLKCAWNN